MSGSGLAVNDAEVEESAEGLTDGVAAADALGMTAGPVVSTALFSIPS